MVFEDVNKSKSSVIWDLGLMLRSIQYFSQLFKFWYSKKREYSNECEYK